jgi:hypothetical protein
MTEVIIFLVVPLLLLLMLVLGFYLGINDIDVFADGSQEDGMDASDWSHINHLL